MKIGFVRHSLSNRGGDKVILAYAGYLAQQGHDVSLWVSEVDTFFEISPLIKIHRLKSRTKCGTIFSVFAVRFPVDVLIVDIVALAAFLTFRYCRKTVYFAQDYDESYYASPAMKMVVRILYYYALRVRRVCVIAVSDELAVLLDKRFQAKTEVVPNGIDDNHFFPDPDPQLGKDKGLRQAIVILARKDFRKGLDIALNVLSRLAKTCHREQVVIWSVGEPIVVPGLFIQNFGFVTPDRMRRIFSSADIFLLPTRHEGFSLTVLEAMACGTVVVTTAAVPIAVQAENAFVSPVNGEDSIFENLQTALSREDLRNALKQKGFETSRLFNLKASQKRFEAALNALVKTGGIVGA